MPSCSILVLCSFIYNFMYIESFLNRHLQREYWYRYNTNHSGNGWLAIFMKFSSFSAAMAVVSMAVIAWETSRDAIFFIITINVLTRTYQLRIFYYSICVETILIELEEAVAASTSINALGVVRQSYRQIFGMIHRVEDIFGYSQLTLIAYCFFQLIIDCNWYYVHLEKKDLTRSGRS